MTHWNSNACTLRHLTQFYHLRLPLTSVSLPLLLCVHSLIHATSFLQWTIDIDDWWLHSHFSSLSQIWIDDCIVDVFHRLPSVYFISDLLSCFCSINSFTSGVVLLDETWSCSKYQLSLMALLYSISWSFMYSHAILLPPIHHSFLLLLWIPFNLPYLILIVSYLSRCLSSLCHDVSWFPFAFHY